MQECVFNDIVSEDIEAALIFILHMWKFVNIVDVFCVYFVFILT